MTVLILQGDVATREILIRELAALSMSVVEANSVAEAKTLPRPDVILTSWSLPDGTPRDLQLGVPVIVVSGYEAPPDGQGWSGHWLRKPLHMASLRDTLTAAIGMAGE